MCEPQGAVTSPLVEQLLFRKGPLKGGSTAGTQDVLSYPLLS